jgi:hypothetical protein
MSGIRGRTTKDLRQSTQKLHLIQGELLSYHPYLVELRRSVEFACKICQGDGSETDAESDTTTMRRVLKAECEKLIVEIGRLDESRKTPAERLGNVINLVKPISLSMHG